MPPSMVYLPTFAYIWSFGPFGNWLVFSMENLEKHMAATSSPGSFAPAALGFSAIHGAAQARSGAEPWSENGMVWKWSGWLFGTFFIFLYIDYIGNVIIPTDFHIFQRGRYTTNQWYSLAYQIPESETSAGRAGLMTSRHVGIQYNFRREACERPPSNTPSTGGGCKSQMHKTQIEPAQTRINRLAYHVCSFEVSLWRLHSCSVVALQWVHQLLKM